MNFISKFFINLFIVFSLMMNCFFASSAQGVINSDADSGEVFEFLQKTGAVDKNLIYSPGQKVTRAEFVKLALNAVNIYASKNNTMETVFTDVSVTSLYAPYIRMAYDMKIISGNSNSLFNPDEVITFEQALKVICSILGYGEIAEQKGGYPTGYYMMAQQYGLLDGIEISGNFEVTYSDAFLLLKNALSADLLKVVSFGDEYSIGHTENETILSRYFGICEIEGVVTANVFTDLIAPETDLKHNQIMIDEDVFFVGESNAGKYLGYKVTAYYNEDSMELCYIEKSEENYELSTYPSEIKFNAHGAEYEEPDGTLKSIKTDEYASFILNGKMESVTLGNLSMISKGEVTFISNDGDRIFDVVIVNDYETFIVSGVSNTSRSVSSKDGRTLCLASDNETFVEILKNGKPIDFSGIKTNNTLLVAESGGEGVKKVCVIVSDTEVEGKVSEVHDESVTIGKKVFKTDKNVLPEIKAGNTYRFLVDSFGYISSTVKINDVVYGCLYAIKSDGLGEYKCKIFTENNHWVELVFAEKVTVNGVRKPKDEAFEFLEQNTVSSDLIRYTVTLDGKFSTVELPQNVAADSDNEEMAINEDVFRKTYSGSQRWKVNSLNFSGKVILDSESKVFIIPTDGDDDEFVATDYSVLYNDETYSFDAYDTDEFHVAGAVVIKNHERKIGISDGFMIVKNLCMSLDREENQCYSVRGYWAGYEITFNVEISDKITYEMYSSLKSGDVVQFALNNTGKIGTMVVHAPNSEGYYLMNSVSTAYAVVGGYVVSCSPERELIRIKDSENSSLALKTVASTSVYIYEKSNGKCITAKVSDILQGDRVIVRTSYLNSQEIVVIRE